MHAIIIVGIAAGVAAYNPKLIPFVYIALLGMILESLGRYFMVAHKVNEAAAENLRSIKITLERIDELIRDRV